ncbi:MAG: FHA domain-containing protein [Saprospiraceae bacterium]|nr:FHA domain-containing protein [Saprospiraceae bacterium]
MAKFTLGRTPQNDIVIDDPSISREHAFITLVSDQEILIEDRDSTYGTFINNREIKSGHSKPFDDLKFGRKEISAAEIFEHVRTITNLSRTDFNEEFKNLEIRFVEYDKQRNKLALTANQKSLQTRLIASVGAAAVVIVLTILLPKEYKVAMGGLSAVLVTVILMISANKNSDMQIKQKLTELQWDYETILACPKCQLPLVSRSYAHWKTKKRCPKCNALWVK